MNLLEARLKVLEDWAGRVEEVLELSREFNPFEICCSDNLDCLILKLLVDHGRATTTEIAKWIQKPLIKAGRKPVGRFAVYHRLQRIQERARQQHRADMLEFHPERRGKHYRFYAVNPLLIDKLRDQAAKAKVDLEKKEKW